MRRGRADRLRARSRRRWTSWCAERISQTLREDVAGTGGELARLLPDLPARISGLPPPVSADPDTERHRLHSSVADLLARAGQRQPLLLVIEDGHWADKPSLMMLRYLARASTEARDAVARDLSRHRG